MRLLTAQVRPARTLAALILLALSLVCSPRTTAQPPERKTTSAFSPVLVEVRLASPAARPGGRLGVTYVWRNEGAPADRDYMVFAHFEHPQPDCAHIAFQQDHFPLIPTSVWETGMVIEDGPYSVPVPADAVQGEYALHVGLWEPPGGGRAFERYCGHVTIDPAAPDAARPAPMAAEEIRRRARSLEARLTAARTIENDRLAFTVSADTGCYRLLDKQSGVAWHSSPFGSGFADAVVRASGTTRYLRLGRPHRVKKADHRLVLEYVAPEARAAWRLEITARLMRDGRSIEFSCAASGAEAHLEQVDLLSDALWTTDAARGYVVIPSRLGLMFPADSGEAYLHRFETYVTGGCQMQMLGVVSGGSAALVTWNDPYAVALVKSIVGADSLAPARQVLAPSLRLRGPRAALRITLLGRGGYVEIARAYRRIARERGWLVTWAEKTRRWPLLELDKLLGAPDIKPFVLSRTVRSSRFFHGPPDAQETTSLDYTFDEAAQIAEHLRRDLGIERALFVLAGWIHRGYDNQHPDILPAAPECGGDAGLAAAAARVRRLGYLFGLHDNYQDMYRDAPSWSQAAIMKRRDGSLMAGGNWAGGQAWLVCSKEGLKFAARPGHNLPRIKELFAPNAYFIDTTFAAELFDCFDPTHPLTRRDDMNYKSALCDFSASLFGVHGSEEGMEWAVPHASYFEGMLSAWGDPPYARRIPLFELVYHDCIALYTHQGDRAYPNRPDYILRLIALGRMPVYGLGPHLYWHHENAAVVGTTAAVERLEQVAPRAFEISYRWLVQHDVAGDWRVFAHFTRENGDIVFQDDHDPEPPASAWRAGQQVVIGPHRIEVPEGIAGAFDVRVGLYDVRDGTRALLPVPDDGMRRHALGRVRVSAARGAARITFEPPASTPRDVLCLARADGGWGEGLCLSDRFIKNTYEVMSPLNALTARVPMTDHQFLTPDGLVQKTAFGDGTEVIVNLSEANFAAATPGGEALLPPYGFSIWGPRFRAFHALTWQGVEYRRPALFAIRSLDSRPLERSRRVRIFHGFGEPVVALAGKVHIVETERIIVRD